MKHSAWIQNRTPTHALDGKTPYEMRHGRKLNLAGIQEFGTAAYIKDLNAGKLDPRACVGRFVGYDSESKGYRIYWPQKKSISVERDVVFNSNDVTSEDDTVPILNDVLAEGEREKILQSLTPAPLSAKSIDEKKEDNPPEAPEETDKVPFPSEPQNDEDPVAVPSPTRHQAERLKDHSAQQPGFYTQQMAKTAHLEAHLASQFMEEENDEEKYIPIEDPEDAEDFEIPPEFDSVATFEALGSSMGNEPRTLDEAFNGLKAAEWKKAYNYELGQLESMGTWEIVDQPEGEKAIPYQIVFKEKLDGEGNIETYRV